MKHFINIFVLLLLSAFACGIAYMVKVDPAADGTSNKWGILFIPETVFLLLWGIKLVKDY